MFSARTLSRAADQWRTILARFPFARRVARQIQAVPDADMREALRVLYAFSPLSDWGNYPFELFRHTAEHDVFLRKQAPEALSETLFCEYVLPLRVNEEALSDCRALFHALLAPRIEGLSAERAILEINYWCAENMTYRSTDTRTISALDAFRSAYGRCGEESTLLVNALRAVGFAARQIYTPRWAHCDDNHAWVEVWLNGEWRFLGACEPEEILDRAWFNSAANRTMLIHSRTFEGGAQPDLLTRRGAVTYLNQTARYAPITRLTVRVRNANGAPVAGARVSFGVLNMSEIYPVAQILTDSDGEAALECGLGNLFVRAVHENRAAEALIDTRDGDCVDLILPDDSQNAQSLANRTVDSSKDGWREWVVCAPVGNGAHMPQLSSEQAARAAERNAAANRLRAERVQEMLNTASALAGENADLLNLFRESRGNCERLATFLANGDDFARRCALLHSLSQKDLRDVTVEALEDALIYANPGSSAQNFSGSHAESTHPAMNFSGLSPAFYRAYVLCPRASGEMLAPVRGKILELFGEAARRDMAENPARIADWIRKHIRCAPELDYDALFTTPAAALRTGFASPRSQDVLFVAICRALGVPARLNPADLQPEYWQNGAFVAPRPRTATLSLVRPAGTAPKYFEDFTIARFDRGEYRTLDLSAAGWQGDALTFPAEPGEYRILTANRLPNGDIHASALQIRLSAGENRAVELRFFPAQLSEMLADYLIDDFALDSGASLASATSGGVILMRLNPGAEPTEHLLGEILAQADAFDALRPAFVLSGSTRENELLHRVLARFPNAPVLTGGREAEWALLAREVYVDPDKLPLAIVADRSLHAIYAASGYNVGLASMLVKIAKKA